MFSSCLYKEYIKWEDLLWESKNNHELLLLDQIMKKYNFFGEWKIIILKNSFIVIYCRCRDFTPSINSNFLCRVFVKGNKKIEVTTSII